MTDRLLERDQLAAALEFVAARACEYLHGLRDEHVLSPGAELGSELWNDSMPERDDGTLLALEELATRARDTASRSSGPRSFTS
jgi:hypothetical protein